MADKQQIILGYHRQGKSQRSIALELGLSHSTVFNVLQRYKTETSATDGSVTDSGVVLVPTYDISKRRKRKLTVEIQQEIDVYLAQNDLKRKNGRTKQQLKAVDIHAAYTLAEGLNIRRNRRDTLKRTSGGVRGWK